MFIGRLEAHRKRQQQQRSSLQKKEVLSKNTNVLQVLRRVSLSPQQQCQESRIYDKVGYARDGRKRLQIQQRLALLPDR